MLNCNLAESIHNKWLQASDNKGGDLYVFTVDEYIRAFFQVVVYHQFFKSGVGGDGPSKEELKLGCTQRRAQRTGDPAVLQIFFFNMPGRDEFCICSPHLEGAKVFGSQKRKPDNPIGAKDETHHPDTVNFFRPCVIQGTTRCHASPLPTIVEESSPTMLEVSLPPPTGLYFWRVTTIQESKVDEKLWDIACVPYNSYKVCWAMHVVIKKKCIAKIVSNSKSTPAPAYLGI
jgi:hypothetical protein